MSAAPLHASTPPWRLYLALTKPRILPMVIVTALPVLLLAAGGLPSAALSLGVLLGIVLVAAAANTLNMYVERDRDKRMARTRNRPLPSAELAPRERASRPTAPEPAKRSSTRAPRIRSGPSRSKSAARARPDVGRASSGTSSLLPFHFPAWMRRPVDAARRRRVFRSGGRTALPEPPGGDLTAAARAGRTGIAAPRS